MRDAGARRDDRLGGGRGGADVPVTVKFRKGWDDDERQRGRVRARDGGRRRRGDRRPRPHARRSSTRARPTGTRSRRSRRRSRVPVIGSGDVFSAGDVEAMLERTGVDAVMVARGAQGNPWIFREARALIDDGERARPARRAFERIDMAREHADALVAFGGERAFVRMRKHVVVVHRRDAGREPRARAGQRLHEPRRARRAARRVPRLPGGTAVTDPADITGELLGPARSGAPLRARAVLRVEVRLLRLRLGRRRGRRLRGGRVRGHPDAGHHVVALGARRRHRDRLLRRRHPIASPRAGRQDARAHPQHARRPSRTPRSPSRPTPTRCRRQSPQRSRAQA